jgi:sugar phosphate isomerase/epimerase
VKINDEYALDLLYKEIPLLDTEIDTCWVGVAGENPAEYVRKYRGRAPVVHLKDYVLEGKAGRMYELIGAETEAEEGAGSFEYRPLGYGQQKIQELLDASVFAGAEWVVIEQDNPSMGKTPFECAEMSIKYLKGLKY